VCHSGYDKALSLLKYYAIKVKVKVKVKVKQSSYRPGVAQNVPGS
jgi:hypothetical protein